MYQLPSVLKTREDFLHYFENIAERLEEIRHIPGNKKQQQFYLDLSTVNGGNVKGMIMVCLNLPMRHSGTLDTIMQTKYFDLYILQAIGEETHKVESTCEACEEVGNKIISKLIHDSNPPNPLIQLFDINALEVSWIDEPLFADKWVGVLLTIPVGNHKIFNYNSAQWL